MKRFAALIGAAVLAIVGYGILNHQHTAGAAQPETLPDAAYGSLGMDLVFVHQGDPGVARPFLPNGEPAISREEAIQTVEQNRLIGYPSYHITAKYGLFTSEAGPNMDGTIHQQYKDTPVWAVRVDHTQFGLPGPASSKIGHVTDEFVFLVDAQTGQLGASFSG